MKTVPVNVVIAVCFTPSTGHLGTSYRGRKPWTCDRETKHFEELTGQTMDPHKRNAILMGRGTWLSRGCKPFPHRLNVILSRSRLLNSGNNNNNHDENVFFVLNGDVDRAVRLLSDEPRFNVETVWAIGGENICLEALNHPSFQTLHLTIIHEKFDCDTFFPLYDLVGNRSIELYRSETNIDDERYVTFRVYGRRRPRRRGQAERKTKTNASPNKATTIKDGTAWAEEKMKTLDEIVKDDQCVKKNNDEYKHDMTDNSDDTDDTDDHRDENGDSDDCYDDDDDDEDDAADVGVDIDADADISTNRTEKFTNDNERDEANAEETQYLRLIRDLLDSGNCKNTETNALYSMFGNHLRFSLKNGRIPLLTSRRISWRTVVENTLWTIRGSSDTDDLSLKGIPYWNAVTSRDHLDDMGFVDRQIGDIGPFDGFQMRHFGARYLDKNGGYMGKGT